MNLYELTKKICLFLLTFFIIDFSPQILNQIQPDSGDYLNLHPARQTTYYIAIQVLKTLKIDLIFFQKFFLSFSICILFFSIKKKTNIFLCLAAYILILSNIYYTSFSKTILTESFLFSFINLAIAFLFELRKRFNLFFFCIVLRNYFIIKTYWNSICINFDYTCNYSIKKNKSSIFNHISFFNSKYN
ncbi:MAG: hypothetical protein CL572_04990 [Alphaproteobacteria bacterium]|nr:hypothetical protein [Alphaproteobacteria bacterium]